MTDTTEQQLEPPRGSDEIQAAKLEPGMVISQNDSLITVQEVFSQDGVIYVKGQDDADNPAEFSCRDDVLFQWIAVDDSV